ncbi:ribose-5-phosphate isomerase isoform X3 [Dermacentor albipictus]|uniref:ribose-5-phosphate isomerase isoform X3 n=1 Tax=Dermacentor albipictus TaxID=60249 RepID=UPI0031FD00CA
MDLVEKAKEAAAQRAVDNHIKNNYIVGIGSGSTVVYAVEHLARRVKEHGWKISCVPTSFQAKELIRKHGLVMTDLEESPELNVAIDGADEVDAKLTLIKGGGGCLTQEKIIASCAKEFVVVADYSELVANRSSINRDVAGAFHPRQLCTESKQNNFFDAITVDETADTINAILDANLVVLELLGRRSH